MPVNISRAPAPGGGLVVEADVGADAGDVDQAPAGCVGDAGGAGEVERGAPVGAEQRGRHVGDEAVDEPGVDERARAASAPPSTSAWSTPRPRAARAWRRGRRRRRSARGRHGEHLGAGAQPRRSAASGAASVVTTRVGRETGSNSGPSAGTRPRPSSSTRSGWRHGGGVDVARGEARAGRRARCRHRRPPPANRRAGGGRRRGPAAPVIHCDEPSRRGDATVEAHRGLHDGEGAPEAPVHEVRRERAGGVVGADTDVDVDAGRRGGGRALPRHLRVGILERDDDPGDARLDQRVDARAAVRPWCEHGSSVTYTVAPRARSPAARERLHLGVRRRPGGWVAPSPTTSPSRTTTRSRPTGWRRGPRRPVPAGASARRMSSASATTWSSSPSVPRWAVSRSVQEPTTDGPGSRSAISSPSPIRTLTVGPGFSPGRPHGWRPWARGLPGALVLRLPPVGTLPDPEGISWLSGEL